MFENYISQDAKQQVDYKWWDDDKWNFWGRIYALGRWQTSFSGINPYQVEYTCDGKMPGKLIKRENAYTQYSQVGVKLQVEFWYDRKIAKKLFR